MSAPEYVDIGGGFELDLGKVRRMARKRCWRRDPSMSQEDLFQELVLEALLLVRQYGDLPPDRLCRVLLRSLAMHATQAQHQAARHSAGAPAAPRRGGRQRPYRAYDVDLTKYPDSGGLSVVMVDALVDAERALGRDSLALAVVRALLDPAEAPPARPGSRYRHATVGGDVARHLGVPPRAAYDAFEEAVVSLDAARRREEVA